MKSPLPESFKASIVESDGHDTVLSEIPDIALGLVWPGAMARTRRNDLIERWAGREWALRSHRADAARGISEARKAGDAKNALLFFGQDAGLIDELLPAGEVVKRIAEEAAEVLQTKLPGVLKKNG